METIARTFDNNAAGPKNYLWQYLKCKRFHGFEFLRDTEVESYSVDFVSPEAMLVLEVASDEASVNEQALQQQSKKLHKLGYRVLRFSRHQVLNKTDEVLEAIDSSLVKLPELKPLPTGTWVGF